MNVNYKAALLSGLVLPGLGQIYKGEKIKGTVLIILVNIFILAALYMVLRSLAPLLMSMGGARVPESAELMERLRGEGGIGRLLLAAFCGLWFYSWIDAAVGKQGRE